MVIKYYGFRLHLLFLIIKLQSKILNQSSDGDWNYFQILKKISQSTWDNPKPCVPKGTTPL